MTSLLAQIRERVRQSSDQPCVVSSNETWSFGQLWEQAARVASYLRSNGLQGGDRVALLAENSPQYMAVFYGVLLAGGAVVPMNTQAKTRDFENWIHHAGARFAFVDFVPRETHKLLQLSLPATLVAVNRQVAAVVPETLLHGIEADWNDIEAVTADERHLLLDPAVSQLACIIYTSGTTGNPKGVMISHGNLAANVASILAALPIQPGDRFLNVLPFYYSYGNSVLHTHVVMGATLLLENSLMYPHKVVARLQDERITGFAGVPSTFALLLSRGKVAEHDLSALRYVLQAGGAMAVPLTQSVIAQMSPNLYVMYGQTEATARLTCLPAARLPDKMGSVGLPIRDVTIEIRRPDGQRCDPGESGELYVQGGNVALGYWNNPAATAETFVDGWLKTGDLGYADEEGFIYLQGRRSDMIKSGANRISPLEIEEVIQQLPGIEEVAVVGVPDELLGQVIAAFVVMKPDHAFDIKQIKKHCLDNLASYKIPKQVIQMDALPKTASGKIRKHMLAESIEEQI